MPRVSVIIPTFDRAALLSETLDSVLAQTYPDVEVVVCDDGSNDGTARVLEPFVDAGVRVLHLPHRGVAAARNAGLAHATGELVAFVDSDDLWEPDKLARQVALFDGDRALAWVYTDAIAFCGVTRAPLYLCSRLAPQFEGDVARRLLRGNFVPSPTPVVRRDAMQEIGGFSALAPAEDWCAWLSLAARHRVRRVPRPLARYRVHPGSTIERSNVSMLFEVERSVIERAVQMAPDRYAATRQQALAALHVRTGKRHVAAGDLPAARAAFRAAMAAYPPGGEPYLLWLGSLPGRRFVEAVRGLKRWLRDPGRSASFETAPAARKAPSCRD